MLQCHPVADRVRGGILTVVCRLTPDEREYDRQHKKKSKNMPHKTPSLMKSVSCYNPRRNSCCTAYRHGAPHNRADPLQIPSFAFIIRCRYFRCGGNHENYVCTRIRFPSSEILLGICLSIVYKIPSLYVNIQIYQNTATDTVHIIQTQYCGQHYTHTCPPIKTPCSIS